MIWFIAGLSAGIGIGIFGTLWYIDHHLMELKKRGGTITVNGENL